MVLATCLLFHSFGAQKPYLLTSLDNRLTDALFRWRGPAKTTESVVIIDIDEKSLKKIGQWPWPRNILAQLVQKLNAESPKAIGFDIVFAEEDRTSPVHIIKTVRHFFNDKLPDPQTLSNNAILNFDLALGEAIAAAPTVLGYVFQLRNDGSKTEGEAPFPSAQINIQPDTSPLTGLSLISAYRAVINILDIAQGESEGFFNVFPDPSGTVRKVPLLMKLNRIPYPSLALETFRVGQKKTHITIHTSRSLKTPQIGILGLSVGDRFTPTDETGQILVNYRGPVDSFPYISAVDVLAGRHRVSFQNKYILIGSSAAGLYDLSATPFSNSVPGVEIHATIIDNLIAGNPLKHDTFTEIGITYALIVVGGLILSALLAYSGPMAGGLSGLAFIIAAFFGNFYIFFLQGKVVGITYPILSFMTVFLTVTLSNYFFEGREKRFIHNAFGRYVSPRVVNQLMRSPGKLSLAGEQKDLTIFFSDIRGFTNISEQMSSEQLGRFMNEYLTMMSDIILTHGGTVDKFIGDAIMAMWGAPHEDKAHATHAVRTALEMMNKIKTAQKDWNTRSLPSIDIGIGINTGTMSVGNFGSRERFDYTVMGDNVNLGARLESANKDYGTHVIISEYTKKEIGNRFFCRYLDKVAVKGKTEAVTIYEPLLEGLPDESLRCEVVDFENAVKDYLDQNFDNAYKVLNRLYQKNPLRLYAIYMHRIKNFLNSPPPPDWDGIERRSHLPDELNIELNFDF